MKARVLVADDSATIQKVVELTLSRIGVELVQARSAQETMRKVKEQKPDLMLIDHSMPDGPGQELCSTLRKDPRLKDVPIILMAGTLKPVGEAEMRRVGATDVVAKPFDSQTLIGKVKQLLRAPTTPAEVLETEKTPEEAFAVESPEMVGEEIRLPADVLRQAPLALEPSEESIPTYDLSSTAGQEMPLGEMAHEDMPTMATSEIGDLAFEEMAAAVGIEMPGPRTREEGTAGAASGSQAVRETAAVPGTPQPLTVPAELVETLAREVAERVATHIVQELKGELLERVNRLLWEVVPDLAEQLITQEIQRIRELVEGKQ
jgi:CheY-like chemotaxis protein